MKLSYPLAIFAATAVFISSFTANAQTDSGTVFESSAEWLTAAGATEGSTIVSGIAPDETAGLTLEESFELVFDIEEGVVPALSELNFPWGTITNDLGIFSSFTHGAFTPGATTEGTVPFSFLAGEGTVTLTPDADLGVPIGVCLVQPTLADEINDLTYNIFDGDTLLETLSFSTSTDESGETINDSLEGYIAPPGAQITRVEVVPVIQFPFSELFSGPDALGLEFAGSATNIKFLFADELEVEPPVEPTCQESLASIAADIDALAATVGNAGSKRCVEIAANLIEYAADDIFFEEDGERLSVYGGRLFTYSAYAIYYLQASGADGTDELVEQILAKLDAIVDSEIDYAIANNGDSRLIDRAEDLVEIAEFIDEDLGNEFVATIAYKLAWLNAYLATY